MQSKSLLIAIAAFAVTATGVHAYTGSRLLNRAGLTQEQVLAIEEAQELRADGDLRSARDKLLAAGINEKSLKSIHQAAQETQFEMLKALKTDDYESFKKSVADSPLGDIITSEADFADFREAHERRIAGEWEEAHRMLDELGIEVGIQQKHYYVPAQKQKVEMTEAQQQALLVARQANDQATMQAIFDEVNG